MNPNNNEPLPANYLDQIATHSHKNNSLLTKKPLIIGLVVALLLSFVLLTASGTANSPKNMSTLAARLKVTSDMAISADTKIKNNQLNALNSDLKIYLTDTIRDITPILKTNNIKITSLDKKILSSEAQTNVMNSLEDARLNGIYDRTYSKKMLNQIDSVMSLMSEIYKSSNNKTFKSFLDNAYKNLGPLRDRFSNFYDSSN